MSRVAGTKHVRMWVVVTVLLWVWAAFGTALSKPGYSHASQYISELGATGTPFAWQASWLGFAPFGVAILVLLLIARRFVPVRGIGRVGYWLLAMESVAWIGAAAAPCDAGCSAEGSTAQSVHNLVGLLTYLGTALGVVLIACSPGLRGVVRVLLWVAVVAWLVLFGAMLTPGFEAVRGYAQRAAEVILYGTLLVLLWRCIDSAPGQARAMIGE